jgi:pyruvate dehydrogenase E2 component (dihydrolipoamide acetyltransferase)
MPKLGQAEEEATVVRWLKKEGDAVAKGELLFEIETDKALLEVESFFEGTLLKIVAGEGQTVPVQLSVT